MSRDLFGHETPVKVITGEKYSGIIKHRTHAAVLFFTGEKDVWLPLSLIAIEETGEKRLTRDMKEETHALITIPDRLAKEKGIIE